MIRPSLNASLSLLQALTQYIDQGSTNASFIFYDDPQPVSPAIDANNSAKLLIVELPKPCFKQIHLDSIELMPSNEGTVVKTGTAVWARLYNGEGFAVADFNCVANMNLNTRDLVLGGSFKLDAITFRPPT